MKRLVILAATAALVVGLPAIALAQGRPNTFEAQLKSLNGSGASAHAWITLDGSTLTIHMEEAGLEPGMVHPQHVHGKLPGDATASPTIISKCPAPSRDTDGDGLVSFAEGLPDYGGVLVNFGAPVAAADGTFTLDATLEVDPNIDLNSRALVIHGLTVAGAYNASLPVACGQVHAQG
jgi:hypothetical protein